MSIRVVKDLTVNNIDLYVAGSSSLDDEGELEVFSSYARSLESAIEQAENNYGAVYRLEKAGITPQAPINTEVTEEGVWTVYTDDGVYYFQSELKAYRYAYTQRHDNDALVKFNAYTEGL